MDTNTAISSWYQGGKQDNGCIAEEAFRAVQKYFQQSRILTCEEKTLVTGSQSMEDAQSLVTATLEKYKATKASSKVRGWLERTSEIICHYGTILDVFVQHHPEYVSLRISVASDNITELTAVGSQTELRVMHTAHSGKLNGILSAMEDAEKSHQQQLDGLTQLVSGLKVSNERNEKKLDLIVSLLEASGLTMNDLITKVENFGVSWGADFVGIAQLRQIKACFHVNGSRPDKVSHVSGVAVERFFKDGKGVVVSILTIPYYAEAKRLAEALWASILSSLDQADGFNLIDELCIMLDDASIEGLKVKIVLLLYEAEWLRMAAKTDSGETVLIKSMKAKRAQAKGRKQTVAKRLVGRSKLGLK
ncbi:hypothetical protein Landi51_00525 [Colletotrichum acutatum]